MRLGLVGGYSGKIVEMPWDAIQRAEELGFDSFWTAEAYGSDAITPAAYVLARTEKIRVGTAIMQMPARTPACTAMTAMTLNQLSKRPFHPRPRAVRARRSSRAGTAWPTAAR